MCLGIVFYKGVIANAFFFIIKRKKIFELKKISKYFFLQNIRRSNSEVCDHISF